MPVKDLSDSQGVMIHRLGTTNKRLPFRNHVCSLLDCEVSFIPSERSAATQRIALSNELQELVDASSLCVCTWITTGLSDKKHMQSHGWKLAYLSHWPWLRQLWSRAIREIMCLADQLNVCIKWPMKMGSHQGLKNTGNTKPNQPGNSRAEGWEEMPAWHLIFTRQRANGTQCVS